ncbi:WD40 repeat domain-containing protein [Kitasatospora kifunensis]|uniref:WD40 repeat protein n=1 Tax=Kitasatospora kifunensis TaxID=58351 RepID=A0A7W7R819_KITKI|nr:WD40 repeat domain-containing protein [Kitasatospora kifunensis]MBB4926843.1 WD40 repeat protein [Kitasatospora kifunensis]
MSEIAGSASIGSASAGSASTGPAAAGLRLISEGADHLPGGATEVFLGLDGAFRVTAGARVRTGTADTAFLRRVASELRAAPAGADADRAATGAARSLTSTGVPGHADSVWIDGTAHPVPAFATLLGALAARVLRPADPAALPAALLRLDPVVAALATGRAVATIGVVRGRAAYALAEQDGSFGLTALDDAQPLGGSGPEAGLLPTAVALGTAAGRELFAVGGADGAVQVWDAVSGAVLHGTSGGEGAQAVAAALVQDVPLAFSGGADGGDVRAMRADTGQALGTLSVGGRGADVLCAARCADLDLLAAAGQDGVIRVWDVASGTQLHLLVGHVGPVAALAVLSLGDQAVLASGGADRRIRLWDLATGQPVAELDGHTATVTGLAFTELADRPVLASCALDGTVRTWDVRRAEALHGWPVGEEWLTGIVAVASGAGPVLVVAQQNGRLSRWVAATGSTLGEFTVPGAAAHPVTALAGGELTGRPVLAAGYGDGTLRLWDAGIGVELYALAPDGGPITSLAVGQGGPDGGVLVCGTAAGAVRSHALRDGAPLRVPAPHAGAVTGLAFGAGSGSGGEATALVSAGADGTVRVRSALDGTPLLQLATGQDGVTALAAGEASGHLLLATAGRDRTVRLWHGVSGQAGPVCEGLAAPAETIAFGVFGGRPVVIGGGTDGSVLVWEVHDGSRVAALTGGAAAVRTLVAQDLDGETLLAAGDEQGTLRLWHLPSGTLLNEAGLAQAALAISFADTGLTVVGPGGVTTL